jgi:hypothetical protein
MSKPHILEAVGYAALTSSIPSLLLGRVELFAALLWAAIALLEVASILNPRYVGE